LTITAWGEIPDRPVEVPLTWLERAVDREEVGTTVAETALYKQGLAAERSGQWGRAQQIWREVIALNGRRKSEAQDHLELDRQAESGRAAQAQTYLKALALWDANNFAAARTAFKRIAADSRAGPIRAHALFRLAELSYRERRYVMAAKEFQEIARRFPKNPRAEAALIMVPRCLLIDTASLGSNKEKQLPMAQAISQSRAALSKLQIAFPRGRFRHAILGWLGRCDYLKGNFDLALFDYLRQSTASENIDQKISALSSIRMTLRRLNSGQATEVAKALRRAPDLLLPYLDYRIDHTNASAAELRDLSSLASEVLKLHPKTQLGAPLMARLAEIEYRSGSFLRATEWSNRSLGEIGSQGVDLARYVRGSARMKLGEFAESQRDFESLVRDYPNSYLMDCARENLALLYERKGDFGRALVMYFALGYVPDAAFILDARASENDLEGFLSEHPGHPKMQLVRYSLGMRLLRSEKFEAAAKIFESIPEKTLGELWGASDPTEYRWLRGFDRLQNPLQTCAELASLQRVLDAAADDETKANAMYAMGSYFYERRNLLLYNAPAWQGTRQYLGWAWNPEVSTSQDVAHIDASTLEQECVERAKSICLKLASLYPRAQVAAKALYRAACCSRRLATFNMWWRNRNALHNQWRDAIQLMRRVSKEYPESALAANATKYAVVFEEEFRASTDSLPTDSTSTSFWGR